eukprot:CAMPEP_0116126142 /NCGR_PEP_ID=MMETSP0329-20121206/6180_1 /TAXON_ID=697910 /ORGANISM="Pseudo-nitzschia arenysensis, Strain B593" /LENGTH=399 /DNA_ID=CAMNT_0003620217 /DNA_START=103 /DNA_END=1301 /DNA_ORIENTATION=+
MNLYDEVSPTLYMSRLVTAITNIVNKTGDEQLDLEIPKDFPIQDLKEFLDNPSTCPDDFNGLSFYDIDVLIRHNGEALIAAFGAKKAPFLQELVNRIRSDLSSDKECLEGGGDPLKHVFLTHHRAIQRKVAAVYCVVKDTLRKRIIATFRASATSRDWKANLDAGIACLCTPKKIRDKMKGSKLQTRVLVHAGFNVYLFDNDKMREDQRFDGMVGDIRTAINKEPGYSVYITGHSLGGALATMFSMKVAGGGSSFNDIPRPITCISFGTPFNGTAGYRTAIEQLEHQGLLRHLRINNSEDLVPAIPPFSFGFRLFKQTGIYLRLNRDGCFLEHSSRANGMTVLRNSMFKPIWGQGKWHKLELQEERLVANAELLRGMKLDDLYKDETIVSKDFIEGNIG